MEAIRNQQLPDYACAQVVSQMQSLLRQFCWFVTKFEPHLFPKQKPRPSSKSTRSKVGEVFCNNEEPFITGWELLLSKPRVEAFLRYCEWRGNSAHSLCNKAKLLQQVMVFLQMEVPLFRLVAYDVWLIHQWLGTKRYGWKHRAQFERSQNKKSFEQLLAEGKAMTAQELKSFHESIYKTLLQIMETWNNLDNKEKRDKFFDFQSCLLILSHIKIAAQRQGSIINFSMENFKFNEKNGRYTVKFDFREKKAREHTTLLSFPKDTNPFWNFFLQIARPWFLESCGRDQKVRVIYCSQLFILVMQRLVNISFFYRKLYLYGWTNPDSPKKLLECIVL